MLNQPTLEKLKQIGLHAMANAWEAQQSDTNLGQLTFDGRLGPLVDAECFARENKRLDRLVRDAKLKIAQACIEGIEYSAKRDLEKVIVRQLATCRWDQEHQAVVITRAPRVG